MWLEMAPKGSLGHVILVPSQSLTSSEKVDFTINSKWGPCEIFAEWRGVNKWVLQKQVILDHIGAFREAQSKWKICSLNFSWDVSWAKRLPTLPPPLTKWRSCTNKHTSRVDLCPPSQWTDQSSDDDCGMRPTWLSLTVLISQNIMPMEYNGPKEELDLTDDRLIRILNYSTSIWHKVLIVLAQGGLEKV